jgi:hypothetical protein
MDTAQTTASVRLGKGADGEENEEDIASDGLPFVERTE